jgi:hypothetical protein
MSSQLGLTPTDIRKKLNSKNEPFGFMGSEDTTTVEAEVLESIEEFEESSFGRLNGRHQELLHYVSGEYLTRKTGAKGGETQFTPGLTPAANLTLYLDYEGNWNDRCELDALVLNTHYTVHPSTYVITLTTALAAGQTLIAEYDHTALANCKLLRKIVKDLVATEWARRRNPDDATFARYLEWERQAYGDLARLRKKDGEKLGIQMFDRLNLVEETQVSRSVSDEYDGDGGMM